MASAAAPAAHKNIVAGSGTGSAWPKSYRNDVAVKTGFSSRLRTNVPVALPLPTTDFVNAGGTSAGRVSGFSRKPLIVPENVNGAEIVVTEEPATMTEGVVNVAVMPSTQISG
jgi:hypothetical protein